jgi:site-specific recombinase XerD
MKKTNNIRKVQEFLGHKFVSTTQVYTGVTKEDLQECAELLTQR